MHRKSTITGTWSGDRKAAYDSSLITVAPSPFAGRPSL